MLSSHPGNTPLSPYIIGALGAFSACAAASALWPLVARARRPGIIESPLHALTNGLSRTRLNRLPYPPDAIPGARDVDTPYGNIRVYEWGPEDGKRVLFLHGISTPCPSLKRLADELVDKAEARVMLIDLFGRGYSSTPTEPHHNLQLYTALIMCAITSSPIPWTGRDTTFTIAGYSLGGGIAATFASYFPSYVSHLVLLAPGGLVREDRVSWKSKILYSTEGMLPERLIEWMVGKRLGKGQKLSTKPLEPSKLIVRKKSERVKRESDGMVRESYCTTDDDSDDVPPESFLKAVPLLGPQYPNSTESKIVSWQLEKCPGFLPAFISCVRHAPIHRQHDRFRALGLALDRYNALQGEAGRKQVLMVLGRLDPIISEDEVLQDVQACLGKRNLKVAVFDTAHDVPIQCPKEVAELIVGMWKETGW